MKRIALIVIIAVSLGAASIIFRNVFFVEPHLVAQAERFNLAHGLVQEMTGQAIVDAALAQTTEEKAQTQEALGFLIMNAAILEGEIKTVRVTGPGKQYPWSRN
jgi:hypothetical protein